MERQPSRIAPFLSIVRIAKVHPLLDVANGLGIRLSLKIKAGETLARLQAPIFMGVGCLEG